MSYCALALEDGAVFTGRAIGASGTCSGEVVFNTAMSGYQEILTDPSYMGQIVAMTAPHIGNYGVNEEDVESRTQHLSGFVVRELAPRHSNARATMALGDYLHGASVIGLAEIDTRALTRRVRSAGAMRAALSTEIQDPRELLRVARAAVPMAGRDLVSAVPAAWAAESEVIAGKRVAVIDCGVKLNILRLLRKAGCSIILTPPTASAEVILEGRPDGVLISNGPGDPAAVTSTADTIRALVGRVPLFGICMGCQLTALALGAKTYKMKFGHHGINHPVLNHDSGLVEITSQNHGFAVDANSLEATGARITHTSLYDGSVEGFAHDGLRVWTLQYHPEAAPGPSDAGHFFKRMIERMALQPDGVEQHAAAAPT